MTQKMQMVKPRDAIEGNAPTLPFYWYRGLFISRLFAFFAGNSHD